MLKEPIEHALDILGRRHGRGLLVLLAVHPQVVVLGPSGHMRTGFLRAERPGRLEQLDSDFVEQKGVDGDPLVRLFSSGTPNQVGQLA